MSQAGARRELHALTALSHPYVEQFKRQLDEVRPGLWSDLGSAPDLGPGPALAVLRYLLDAACVSQNALNIELGRAGLRALPRDWLLERLEEAADPLLHAGGEWEHRRLLEACEELDDSLTRRVALRGARSPDPEVREACAEWLTSPHAP